LPRLQKELRESGGGISTLGSERADAFDETGETDCVRLIVLAEPCLRWLVSEVKAVPLD
jgi:hypothetical protein